MVCSFYAILFSLNVSKESYERSYAPAPVRALLRAAPAGYPVQRP